MNRSRPVHAFVVLCAFFVPATALPQSDPPAVAAAAKAPAGPETPTIAVSKTSGIEADIPPDISNLIRNSQLKYQEGSKLIKSGESAKARAAFDAALDMLLHSDYDLNTTPVLNEYFQDLIHRIQEDESRYLSPPEDSEDKPEEAVVDELDKLDLIPIQVDPSLQDKVVADLENTEYDIPIILNEKVLKSLNFWISKGRKFFVDGLIRSGRYRDMIERIFREESIPLDIMYLAQVESLFKTNALSRARAKGIWQFERSTATGYGLKVNSYVDERSDPEKSTRAAARYLRDLYGMFKDWNLVLAAYNWGEANVQRLMARSGLNDFWQMTELRRRNFPVETKNHVPLIMASIILAHNPEKYGLPKEFDPPQTYDVVAVTKPIDLREVARILNTTLDELRQLNPALRGLSTPANYPGFELKVPPSRLQPETAEKIAELPAVKFKPPPENEDRYRIRKGDTLSSIAARHRVTVAQLERANKGISPKSLQIGRWIRIRPITSRVSSQVRPTRVRSARITTSASSISKAPRKASIRSNKAGKSTASSKSKAPPVVTKVPQSKKEQAGEIASR